MSADRLALLLALIVLALGLILSRREPLKTALPFWIIPWPSSLAFFRVCSNGATAGKTRGR